MKIEFFACKHLDFSTNQDIKLKKYGSLFCLEENEKSYMYCSLLKEKLAPWRCTCGQYKKCNEYLDKLFQLELEKSGLTNKDILKMAQKVGLIDGYWFKKESGEYSKRAKQVLKFYQEATKDE